MKVIKNYRLYYIKYFYLPFNKNKSGYTHDDIDCMTHQLYL